MPTPVQWEAWSSRLRKNFEKTAEKITMEPRSICQTEAGIQRRPMFIIAVAHISHRAGVHTMQYCFHTAIGFLPPFTLSELTRGCFSEGLV